MSDELMVEGKSRLSVLVIEDNAEFAGNAMRALAEGTLILGFAKTLEEAKELIKANKYDAILSDVHFPVKDGEEPSANVREVLFMCLDTGTPVCFVTRADHHGMLDLGDEGYVSLKATTQGRVLQTQLKMSRKGGDASEAGIFRSLETTESENVRSGSKTQEIWSRALSMALNARTKPTSIGMAMRKVGEIGLGVVADNGMPRVVPKK